MTTVKEAADAIVAAVAEEITQIGELATRIGDLTAQLKAAQDANDPAAAQLIVDELAKATADLKAAHDAAAGAVAPAATPAA